MDAKQLNKFNIKNKMILLLLSSIFCIFVGLTVIIYNSKYEALQKEKIIQLKVIAQICVNNIANDFVGYYNEAKNFNMLISNFKDISPSYRAKYFSDLTREFLVNEPKSNCFWLYLDSKDSCHINTYLIKNPYVNPNYFDKKNTFNISWYHDGDKISSESDWKFSEAKEESYFVRPILEERAVISEPYVYLYDYDNKNVPDSLKKQSLVITISSPVFDANRNIIGVTGIDIDLQNIVYYANFVYVDSSTSLTLISDSGKYLFHQNKELINKKMTENPLFDGLDLIDSIFNLVRRGNEFDIEIESNEFESKKIFLSYSLIDLSEELQFKITLRTRTPYSTITQTSNKLIFNIIICFIVAFILIAGAVLLVSAKFNYIYSSRTIIKLQQNKEET